MRGERDSHYHREVEPIDLIEAFDLDFCAGNVIKYVARAKHKGNYSDDLRKAKYYLERLINHDKKKQDNNIQSKSNRRPSRGIAGGTHKR